MVTCSYIETGDLISWEKENWVSVEDVSIEDVDQDYFCKELVAKHFVGIPEPVTFSDAKFLTNFLSCEIPSASDDMKEFHSTIKNGLDLQVQKYCSS